MKLKALLPNWITCTRIVFASTLLFLAPLSLPYFIVYTLGGLSDAVDGFLARLWRVESRLGSLLDSIADLFFFAVMFITMMPTLLTKVPAPMWWVMGGILLLRLGGYLLAAIKFHRFASLHTYLNKATGFALFLVPYLVPSPLFPAFCVILLLLGSLAAIEEGVLHLRTAPGEDAGKTVFGGKRA